MMLDPKTPLLKEWRAQKGLSQTEAAIALGVPVRTLQGWEAGTRSPVSADFFRVVRELGVSADVFAVIAAPARKSKRKGKQP